MATVGCEPRWGIDQDNPFGVLHIVFCAAHPQFSQVGPNPIGLQIEFDVHKNLQDQIRIADLATASADLQLLHVGDPKSREKGTSSQ